MTYETTASYTEVVDMTAMFPEAPEGVKVFATPTGMSIGWYDDVASPAEWGFYLKHSWDDVEPDDYPVTLGDKVTEAMMLMALDMEAGNQDNLGEVNRLNAEIWEEVKPGPGEAPVEYWRMTVDYLGY